MDQEKIIKQILNRLERLESAVFRKNDQKIKLSKKKVKSFKGTTGGIRLLISKSFFKGKKKSI